MTTVTNDEERIVHYTDYEFRNGDGDDDERAKKKFWQRKTRKIMMPKASRDIWRSIVIRYRTHARLCWWVNGRVDGEGFGF